MSQFCSSSTSFSYFLEISVSLLTFISICNGLAWHLLYPLALSIFIIVFLKIPCLTIPKSLPYLSLVMISALHLQTMVSLPSSMPYNFPWYPDIIYWIIGTTVSRLLVMWWKCMREEAFYLPMIISQSFSEPVSLNCEIHNS